MHFSGKSTEFVNRIAERIMRGEPIAGKDLFLDMNNRFFMHEGEHVFRHETPRGAVETVTVDDLRPMGYFDTEMVSKVKDLIDEKQTG